MAATKKELAARWCLAEEHMQRACDQLDVINDQISTMQGDYSRVASQEPNNPISIQFQLKAMEDLRKIYKEFALCKAEEMAATWDELEELGGTLEDLDLWETGRDLGAV